MKLSARFIICIWIYILVAINLGIFKFVYMDAFIETTNLISSIILAIVCRCNRKIYRQCKNIYFKLDFFVTFYGVFLVIENIYSLLFIENGKQGGIGLAFILLSYAVAYILSTYDRVEIFMHRLVVLTFISVFLRAISWYLFNYQNITFMEPLLYDFGGSWMRKGVQRIPVTEFSGLTFCYALSYVLSGKKKSRILYIFYIISELVYVYVVAQARSLVIVFGILIFIVLLLLSKKSLRKKIFAYICVTFIVAFAFFSKSAMVFWYTFQSYSFSTNIRLIALNHFSGKWLSSYSTFLFGLGYSNYLIDYGKTGSFSDLGLLGVLFHFGLIGFVALTSIMTYMSFVSIKMCKKQINEKKIFAISSTAYIILSSILSNSVFDPRRNIMIPFYIALFVCITELVKKESIESN